MSETVIVSGPVTPESQLAFRQAAEGGWGAAESDWEAALRHLVQQQLAIATLRLADAVPDMLSDTPQTPPAVDLVLPLPAGERLRFTAMLERVA